MNDQMEKTVSWVLRRRDSAPPWANFMFCHRSNQYHGHFSEKKPQFDRKMGTFFVNGGRSDHFRSDNPGWSIRYGLNSGVVRIMESGDNTNILEELEQKPVCSYCGIVITDSNSSSTPVKTEFGLNTFTVDYDVLHRDCGRETTIRFKILSPAHIIDGEPKNL